MAQLWNATQNLVVADHVVMASSFWSRLKGLLGLPGWPKGQALWIHQCNSIHTFFMKFSIDVVFVSRDLEVKAVYKNIAPWRLVLPVWRAASVFELAQGELSDDNVRVGDQLNVRS